MNSLVQHISDTALWVAIYRAQENERPDAVFHDPYARRLAGEKGEQIARQITFSRRISWSFIARTWLFDKIVTDHVADGFTRVINLAAGLDARPYRMALPPSLRWIEVDLPDMISYKQSVLAGEKPVCSLESIALDLANRTQRKVLFEHLGQDPAKTLVISEGLMIYLSEREAGELADDLHVQASFKHWAFDLSSPAVLKTVQKKVQPHLKEGQIAFKFAPAEGEDFFTPHGWRSVVSYSKFKMAAKLNRLSFVMRLFSLLPEKPGPHRNFPWSGVCLFENQPQ